MATNISDIPNLEKQISGLKDQSSTYQDRLNSSPTALGGTGTPSTYDISNQESLQRLQGEIQGLTDKKLKTQWYGTDTRANQEGEAEPSQGIIGTTLDYLSRPLYGVVGATKHIIGQGSGSLQQDVADNIKRNKNTFGDVLKTANVPWAVAAPLGFALDIGMDPVNWLTMGSGALVPRLAVGAYKGVETGEGLLKGISAAAKSGVLEKANTIGRFTPFFRKSETFAKLGEGALKATDTWEALSGLNAGKLVLQRGAGIGNYRMGLGEMINKVADATPGGQTVLKNFVYDPIEWVRQARIKDIIQDSLGSGVDLKGAINASVKGESIEPFLKQASEEITAKVKSTPVGKSLFDIDIDSGANVVANNKDIDKKMAELAGIGLDKKLSQLAPKIVNGVDDASEIMKNPSPYISSDPIENALRIANEKIGGETITIEDLSKIVNSGVLDETGVKWFDNMMRTTRNFKLSVGRNSNRVVEVGKKVMDTYDKAMGIFRVAKVGASPTSYVNAVVGNMLMTHMAGGDIGPEFLGRLNQSWKMYRNKPGAAAFLDDLLMNAGKEMGDENMIRRALGENRTAARGTFGTLDFVNTNYNAERLLRAARDAGIVSSTVKAEDIASDVKKAVEELSQVRVEAGTEPVRSLLKSGKEITRGEIGTGMLTNEMFNSPATAKMFEHVAEKAKADPSNMAWKLLDFSLNKMPSNYETIDQTFKMATFLRATVDGYSLNHLKQLRHLVDINPEELVKYSKKGQYLYRLSPKTAIELANVMYLNYNAMPAAVRVLRNFPLLGSPFVSFMYGMTLKTGQTLAYNPSAFNKVTFAMNDFGGTKNPLEKKALDTQFYSYLKQPGMFRTPFFNENPIYLNMASMIPYYSLNMFNPTKTEYGDTVPEKLAQYIQSSPILKDPVGSTLFDYLIQPLILGEAIRPQGQFGQPLYPVDATALEKMGYGARSLGEAFVPNVASYAGLLPTPEAVVDYIPSYRWRQLARAKAGKNQLGISSKEPAVSRTVRTLFQATGVPVQAPVNTTFVQGQK